MNKTINSQIYIMRILRLLIFYCLLVIINSSCNTIRHTLKEPIKEKGADYLFEKLKKNEIQYKWLSAKFSATIDYNNKKNSFSGIVRMRYDSLIWISITPVLGIEAARMVITNDSVKLINRFDKTYIISDYDYVNSLLNSGFDFNMIESLLTGNDFAYYDTDKFKAKVDNGEYRLSTVNRQKIKRFVKRSPQSTVNSPLKILLQDIWLNPETFKIIRTSINEIKENRKITLEYSDFENISNKLFPQKIAFNLTDKKPINFTIKYSKVTFDEKQSFPFKVPQDYHKMEIRK